MVSTKKIMYWHPIARGLIEMGLNIIGYDNLNSYYDQTLKYRRLEIIKKFSEITYVHCIPKELCMNMLKK